MSDGGRGSREDQWPLTPRTSEQLKTLRYEDATKGGPPVPITSVNAPLRTSSAGQTNDPPSPRRPSSAPGPRPTTFAEEQKRDSAFAASLSTAAHRGSSEDGQQASATGGAAREPALPTIVVQDEETLESHHWTKSPLFGFGKKSKERARPATARTPSAKDTGLQRIGSFKAIKTNIPSSDSDAIDLNDLTSDKVGFSNRGSLLFGGKKMHELIAAQGDGAALSNVESHPDEEKDQTPTQAVSEAPPAVETEAPKRPLVAGRRKPSVQMLQAALHGGRVLSAEEIGFSLKVRSMYEAGDERAADWMQGAPSIESRSATPEAFLKDTSSPDLSASSKPADNGNQTPDPHLRPQSPQDARKSYNREPHEYAGGIEDWEDVSGQDVDRYGFINARRMASRPSTTSQAEGVHRVATALLDEARQPRRDRKLHRGISNARSSRSVPPRRGSDGTMKKAAGSMRSFRSGETRSASGSLFMSRDKRTLAEAGDMLTLPPGLSDIAEQEDAGRTASMLKRREWSRDEKWQKMATSTREPADSKGGGMRFAFDTSDPKLVNRTWKGIPDRWRATAWHSFLSASAKRRGSSLSDEELIESFYRLQEISSADDVQIDVDVPRTINMHIMFRRRYRGGQRLLFRVLHAISVYCPEPGYVQGMASLAATLLCYYEEERAFVMMVRLWQLRGLEQLFKMEFEGLMAALSEFERDWLRGGDVAQKLDELSIPSTSYGTRWYLTLFNLSIPFPAQLRVWDVFMLLGDAPSGEGRDFGGADLDVLHATSAALVDATREILLDADFENAMKVLTSFVPIKDEDLLMRVARTEWKMKKKRAGVKV
ncbi:RabGAP/TBC [Hortaea werneckii]|uniref:Rab-GAP TBC domain-containing protein n=1 Tax=Hortaea werneckii TaxID=91943 RepID=A0A3M7G437_HORWE|nr:RabGAP/TBC [Hortaea werneckii]KAI6996150.1 RabGAP/TBC [Hortaea werneckii]KAI7147682.1 RabGAP/TBC [Hortaea werneckii]KAI7176701.1 RabGAP/TBC [Hortaea werneckii]KAI7196924.1 RabGAP/TBC [Hortaea werneckii]